jgi:aryl-alcohol dehydrogenase-like predicted oxidoreductase
MSSRRTNLGMTGLGVSRICFGSWQLGSDWGSFEEEAAIGAIRRARELGIDFFDTAQGYGWGESERLIGRALGDELRSNRDELVIATKGGLRIEGGELRRDSSPDWLRRGVDFSLEALGVDHVDLYQVHWPDLDTPFSETAGALQELVDAGKIRHVGVSNFDVGEMAEFARTRPVETLQPPYHLFRRDIEEDVLPYCREHDIGVLVYGPLGHGLLSGAIDENTTFPENDWRGESELFRGENLTRNVEAVRRLEELAGEGGHTVSQLAIAWTLANPAVQVAIVGTRNADHIAEALGAADIELSEGDLARIDEIVAEGVPVGGPTPDSGGR